MRLTQVKNTCIGGIANEIAAAEKAVLPLPVHRKPIADYCSHCLWAAEDRRVVGAGTAGFMWQTDWNKEGCLHFYEGDNTGHPTEA